MSYPNDIGEINFYSQDKPFELLKVNTPDSDLTYVVLPQVWIGEKALWGQRRIQRLNLPLYTQIGKPHLVVYRSYGDSRSIQDMVINGLATEHSLIEIKRLISNHVQINKISIMSPYISALIADKMVKDGMGIIIG